MALDTCSTPKISDEPERVFRVASKILSPRRRTLQNDAMQQVLCLRSWQGSGIIALGQQQLQQAVAAAEAIINEDVAYSDYNDLTTHDPQYNALTMNNTRCHCIDYKHREGVAVEVLQQNLRGYTKGLALYGSQPYHTNPCTVQSMLPLNPMSIR